MSELIRADEKRKAEEQLKAKLLEVNSCQYDAEVIYVLLYKKIKDARLKC